MTNKVSVYFIFGINFIINKIDLFLFILLFHKIELRNMLYHILGSYKD